MATVCALYLWFLVMVIIIVCWLSSTLSRLCGCNAVSVLATVILMSYTKLLRTIINVFMFDALQCGEYKWNVWHLDGNIQYLSGKHVALFTVSLLFLIIMLVYSGIVLFLPLVQYARKQNTENPVITLKSLFNAYTYPCKGIYGFWTGIGLIVRLIIGVAVATMHPRLSIYVVLIPVGAMIVFILRAEVYTVKNDV